MQRYGRTVFSVPRVRVQTHHYVRLQPRHRVLRGALAGDFIGGDSECKLEVRTVQGPVCQSGAFGRCSRLGGEQLRMAPRVAAQQRDNYGDHLLPRGYRADPTLLARQHNSVPNLADPHLSGMHSEDAGSKGPSGAKALANDNWYGYVHQVIVEWRVRWIEMAVVLPFWTTLVAYYLEGDRGHLMSEQLGAQKHRWGVAWQLLQLPHALGRHLGELRQMHRR